MTPEWLNIYGTVHVVLELVLFDDVGADEKYTVEDVAVEVVVALKVLTQVYWGLEVVVTLLVLVELDTLLWYLQGKEVVVIVAAEAAESLLGSEIGLVFEVAQVEVQEIGQFVVDSSYDAGMPDDDGGGDKKVDLEVLHYPFDQHLWDGS